MVNGSIVAFPARPRVVFVETFILLSVAVLVPRTTCVQADGWQCKHSITTHLRKLHSGSDGYSHKGKMQKRQIDVFRMIDEIFGPTRRLSFEPVLHHLPVSLLSLSRTFPHTTTTDSAQQQSSSPDIRTASRFCCLPVRLFGLGGQC